MDVMRYKALLKKDWKYSKYFIAVLIGYMFLQFVAFIIDNENNWKGVSIKLLFEFDTFVFFVFSVFLILLLMVTVLFNEERVHDGYIFSELLPFKRVEKILSKWLIGFYNITLAFLIIYMLINLKLFSNYCWRENIVSITKLMVLYYFLAVYFFAIIMTAFSMSGSIAFRYLLSFVFALMNFVVLMIVASLLYFVINLEIPIISDIFDSINQVITKILDFYSFVSHENITIYILRIGLIFVLTVFLFLVTNKMYVKRNLEEVGHLVLISKSLRLIEFFLAQSIGAICFIILFIFSPEVIEENADIFVLFFFIVLPIPVYLLIDKLFKRDIKRHISNMNGGHNCENF